MRSAEERETERMRLPAGEQEKRLDGYGWGSIVGSLSWSWAICALARFWQCVLSACNANTQGPRDGALNLEALNSSCQEPSIFTLVSSPFGLIWRSQFLCYSRKALVSDSSVSRVSRRVLPEVEGACHWLLLFG